MNYFAIMLRQLVAARTDTNFQLAMKAIDEHYETGMLRAEEWSALQCAAHLYNPISYLLYERQKGE